MIKVAKILADDTIEIPEIRLLGVRFVKSYFRMREVSSTLTLHVNAVKRNDRGIAYYCTFDGVPWDFQSTHLVAKFKSIDLKIVLVASPNAGDILNVTYNLSMSGDFT